MRQPGKATGLVEGVGARLRLWSAAVASSAQARAVVAAVILGLAVVSSTHPLGIPALASNSRLVVAEQASPTEPAGSIVEAVRGGAPLPTSTPRACGGGGGGAGGRSGPGQTAILVIEGGVVVSNGIRLPASFKVRNTGPGDAYDLVLGLRVTDGGEFVERVDFDNTQFWITDGLPSPTLFAVDTLPSGGERDITMSITMSDRWAGAPWATEVHIDAAVASSRCVDAPGVTGRVTLARPRAEADATESAPRGSVTATAGTAVVSVGTETPVATRTPVSGVLAAARVPSPVNEVLGAEAQKKPAGQVPPAGGSGFLGDRGVLLLVAAFAVLATAMAVGRRFQ